MPVPTFDPNNFAGPIDNPYFTLQPGTTFITKSPDGSQVDTFVVTRQTKVIDGVTCVVVRDTSKVDGELEEKTADYFAQDKDGNVWYMGEDTAEFQDGKVVSTEGTWRAGVDGAEPGIIMLASPKVGDAYNQENAPGVAEDHAEVLKLNATVTVPYGTFHHVLQTLETSPLDPGIQEKKHYVAGVGFLLATDGGSGEALEHLVKIKVDGSVRGDNLFGYAGGDEMNGNGGNDSLDGRAGADTIHGGNGKDLLNGGNDKAADLLYGDSGNDEIQVGRADLAFGGNGNDLFLLADNRHFGSIDGGGQNNDNLRWSRGDVLQFDGKLDLTAAGISERIHDIETLSMKDGQGNDRLVLNAQDVLSLGDGEFNPFFLRADRFGEGSAVRIDGDAGDKVKLTGGNWQEIEPSNAPSGYDVFACAVTGGNVYVLVQEDITAAMV
jgi:RTX calcium-binding nonapeptide repeat (4 copies)